LRSWPLHRLHGSAGVRVNLDPANFVMYRRRPVQGQTLDPFIVQTNAKTEPAAGTGSEITSADDRGPASSAAKSSEVPLGKAQFISDLSQASMRSAFMVFTIERGSRDDPARDIRLRSIS
jgi:hypothetical protein